MVQAEMGQRNEHWKFKRKRELVDGNPWNIVIMKALLTPVSLSDYVTLN